ncbi:hypothetical protein MCON_3397 [Methanothrix soehngenii GP6]|uniref:Uncharacterized protein n=1 Tax=Methanothrix soehngenii (strain ATCC 5969 / DSM 3671 / JCM 10134 / NBRC 103675 / OCM 69 / GP-6) TaxID=990316 RepID=F4BVM8_METSG|nr:hypothetical protein MCON_3397 [Methanothrix soehngenii GP6]
MKSFNSLFIGIGSAIETVCVCVSEPLFVFQFPFHRDRLCNPRLRDLTTSQELSFNSLFIGIGSAIFCHSTSPCKPVPMFQFPFHRDRLCN